MLNTLVGMGSAALAAVVSYILYPPWVFDTENTSVTGFYSLDCQVLFLPEILSLVVQLLSWSCHEVYYHVRAPAISLLAKRHDWFCSSLDGGV